MKLLRKLCGCGRKKISCWARGYYVSTVRDENDLELIYLGTEKNGRE